MTKTLTVRVLGCGTSSGVPAPGLGWGDCDPNEIKNERTRSSILLGLGAQNLLVDTSPDCRYQLLKAQVDHLDGIFYTHTHADHTHGIDDIRWINQAMGRPIPCWARKNVHDELQHRFAYAYTDDPRPQKQVFRPSLLRRDVGSSFDFAGQSVQVFDQDHGTMLSQGLRIGNFAYSSDVVNLDDSACEVLAGVTTWIVDALSFTAHPTHAHVDKVIGWVEKLKIKRAYLTHMGLKMDFNKLCALLPSHIRPAYDGMEISLALK